MRGSLGSDKHNKVKAMDREKKLAKRLGGYAQPGSGSGDQKGDIITDVYLIDDKFTGKNSYTISTKTLDKLTREANSHDKKPILLIKFTCRVPPFVDNEWCLIRQDDFKGETFDSVDVLTKTTILPIKALSSLKKSSSKRDYDPIRIMSFYKCSLGVSRNWVLCPLTYLEDQGYFQ